MQRPADLDDRLKQVEDEYWKIKYPFLIVDEARRAAGKAGDSEMVYGTTPPAVVLELLELAEVKPDDVFYDLGCGLGVPTVVAALLCKKSVGIEILADVARQAQGVADALSLANASFHVADFKSADVSDGTLIYCYSTCLRAQSRAELAERVAQTRPGTRILTVTHNLEHPALDLKQTREMSWEESHRTVYLHVRK